MAEGRQILAEVKRINAEALERKEQLQAELRRIEADALARTEAMKAKGSGMVREGYDMMYDADVDV